MGAGPEDILGSHGSSVCARPSELLAQRCTFRTCCIAVVESLRGPLDTDRLPLLLMWAYVRVPDRPPDIQPGRQQQLLVYRHDGQR